MHFFHEMCVFHFAEELRALLKQRTNASLAINRFVAGSLAKAVSVRIFCCLQLTLSPLQHVGEVAGVGIPAATHGRTQLEMAIAVQPCISSQAQFQFAVELHIHATE